MARVSSSLLGELSPEERRLIAGLRDLPSEALRHRVAEVMGKVLDFASDPACPERQADGVPCEDTDLACEECQAVLAVLRGVERRVARGL